MGQLSIARWVSFGLSSPEGFLLQIPLRRLITENTLLAGPTGSGKTSLSRLIAHSAINQGAIVIVADRKATEFVQTRSFVDSRAPVTVLGALHWILSVLQPPQGASTTEWGSLIAHILAYAFNLFASERFLCEVLESLYSEKRPPGEYPTWSELVAAARNTKVRGFGRTAGYQEAVLHCLEQIDRELGPALEYTSSDMLEQMQSRPGLFCVSVDYLGLQTVSFLVGLIVQNIFRMRSRQDGPFRPLLFVLDDATGLLRGGGWKESDRGNPIAELLLIGRSVGVGFCVCSHSFASVDPVVRNNCATQVVCGATGGDAAVIGREWALSREQTAELSELRPGEAAVLARTQWPRPIRGRFPEMP